MSMSTGDIFGAVFLVLWMIACLIMLVGIVIMLSRRLFASIKRRRLEKMDDTVDHDEWQVGSPERYIPPDAKPVLFEEGDE